MLFCAVLPLDSYNHTLKEDKIMDNSRMSTADMLQYCDEALAWEEFGPVDIFFFESVKKILLGQCN